MWVYSMREVPTLRNYEAAVKREAEIVPLKSGLLKGHKPVGNRRSTAERIEQMNDGSIRVFQAWRNSPPETYVRYYPDGLIEVKLYTASSTMGFIGKTLGYEMNQRQNRYWVHGVRATRPDTGETVQGSFLLRETRRGDMTPLQFRADPDGTLRLQNPIWPQVRRTRRTEANAVRKDYEQFRRYVRGVIGLNGSVTFTADDLKKQNVHMAAKVTSANRDEFFTMMESPDPADRYKAAMWVIQSEKPTSRRWHFSMPEASDTDTVKADTLKVMKGLDNILLERHADVVFYYEPSYEGRVVE